MHIAHSYDTWGPEGAESVSGHCPIAINVKMALTNVARNINFHANVLGNHIPVNVNIENTYRATIDFTLLNTPYTFTIETWARRGLAGFLTLYHAFTPRDITTYGLRIEDTAGVVNFYENNTDIVQQPDGSFVVGVAARAMTVAQKLNCVEQGCRDIVTCLGQIGYTHQRSMLEYAVWYRENHPSPTTYSQFITLVTCHCILHNDFMASNVSWGIVEFH